MLELFYLAAYIGLGYFLGMWGTQIVISKARRIVLDECPEEAEELGVREDDHDYMVTICSIIWPIFWVICLAVYIKKVTRG